MFWGVGRNAMRSADLAINGRHRQARQWSLAFGIKFPFGNFNVPTPIRAAKGSQTGTFSSNFDD
jgi:hypothetical protein